MHGHITFGSCLCQAGSAAASSPGAASPSTGTIVSLACLFSRFILATLIHFLLAFRMHGHIIFGPCLCQAGAPTPAAASSSTPTIVSLANFYSRLILASLSQSLLALRIGDWELNSELWHSSCTSNWTVCDRGQMANQRQNLQTRLIDSCGLYLHHLVAMTTVTFFTHILNFQVSKKRKRRRSSGHEEKKKRKKELSSAWLITTL